MAAVEGAGGRSASTCRGSSTRPPTRSRPGRPKRARIGFPSLLLRGRHHRQLHRRPTRVANLFVDGDAGNALRARPAAITGEWAGWVDPVAVMPGFGVRMDLVYYTAGPAVWISDRGPRRRTATSMAAACRCGSSPRPARCRPSTSRPPRSPSTSWSSVTTAEHLDAWPKRWPSPASSSTTARPAAIRPSPPSSRSSSTHSTRSSRGSTAPWPTPPASRCRSGPRSAGWNSPRRGRRARSPTTRGTPAPACSPSPVTVPAGAPAQSLMVPPAFAGKVLARVRHRRHDVIPPTLAVNGRISEVIQVAPGAGGAARQVVAALRAGLVAAARSRLPTPRRSRATPARPWSNLTVTSRRSSATDVLRGPRRQQWHRRGAGLDYLPVASGSSLFPAGRPARRCRSRSSATPTTKPTRRDRHALRRISVGATLADATGVLTIVRTTSRSLPSPTPTRPLQHAAERAGAGRACQRQRHRPASPTSSRSLISTTPNGSLTLGANGAVPYTPNLGFAGVDSSPIAPRHVGRHRQHRDRRRSPWPHRPRCSRRRATRLVDCRHSS